MTQTQLNPTRRPSAHLSRAASKRRRPASGGHVEMMEARRLLATFTVTNLADSGPGTLAALIESARLNPGADTIKFSDTFANGTVKSVATRGDDWYGYAAFGIYNQELTIDGQNANGQITIRRDAAAPTMRLFTVYERNGGTAYLTLKNLTLAGGSVKGGDGGANGGGGAGLGGAIYNQGQRVNIIASTLSDNVAKGGRGGVYDADALGPTDSGGGGGGGLTGDGDFNGGGGPNGGASAPFGTLNQGSPGGFGGGGGGGGNLQGLTGSGRAGGFGGGGSGSSLGNVNSNPGLGGFGGGDGANDVFPFSPRIVYAGGGAGLGGAIFNYGGRLDVTDSTIAGNQAVGGDGRDIDTIADNVTPGDGIGGAIFNYTGNFTLVNSTITNNSALRGSTGRSNLYSNGIAGGIYNYAGLVIAVHATIAFNDSGGVSVGSNITYYGEAIFNDGAGGLATATIRNCVLGSKAATAQFPADAFHSVSSNGGSTAVDAPGSYFTSSNVTVAGLTLTPNLSFDGPGNYGGTTQTLRPTAGNPVINGGSTAFFVGNDQRGLPRSGTPDAGAYEMQASTNIALAGGTIAENRPVGTLVGTLSTADADVNEPFVYSLVSGFGSNSQFTITGNQLFAGASFDYEAAPFGLGIRVRSTDSVGQSIDRDFGINLTDVNEAPISVSLSNTTVAENSLVNTVVGGLFAIDVDAGDTKAFSLAPGGPDNAFFNVSGTNLRASNRFDLESRSQYQIRLRVTDSGGLFLDRDYAITITNVNETPTSLAISNDLLPENQPAGTVIGLLQGFDPDAGDTFTYTFAAGFPESASFTINGNQLRANANFNFEAKSQYNFRVRVTDAGGLFNESDVRINVTNVNEAPTNLALDNGTIPENRPADSVVGNLTTADPDAGSSFTYSLAAGGADNSFFVTSAAGLRTAAVLDFEAKPTYQIRIRTTDAGGLFFEKNFTIQATNVNESPTAISLSNASVAENSPAGTLVGNMSLVDPDAGDVLSLAFLAGGADNASFTLTGTAASGYQLVTNASFNFEAKSAYQIRLRTTDAAVLQFDAFKTINVVNVNETPIATADAYTVDQNSSLIADGTPNPAGVLANDTDPDNDPLSAILVTATTHGTLSLNFAGPGKFFYQPNAGYSGPDSFVYRASDGVLQSAITTVNINVRETVAPTVASSQFSFETAPQNVKVVFSEDVGASLSASDFVFTNLATNQLVSRTLTYAAATNTATLSFPFILSDGDYRMTIAAGAVVDAAGNALAGYNFDFFFLMGDINRDRSVGFPDLVTLAQNYNTGGRTFSGGNLDYSADGVVAFADLVILAQTYNAFLPPLLSASPLSVATGDPFATGKGKRKVDNQGLV